MRANGQLVFGYVPCKDEEADICNVRTGGADPDVPQAREGIDNWYNLYPQIDGIYLDEGPLYEGDHISYLNSEKIQENYKDYSNYIQTKRNGRVMMEASAYPFDWILDIAEFILLWRNDVDKYENHYNGYLQRNGPPIDQTFPIPDWRYNLPNWRSTTGPERIIHTTYGHTLGNPQNPSDMADIPKVIEKVKGNCAGSVYLTEDPGPGKLPSYWDQLVQSV